MIAPVPKKPLAENSALARAQMALALAGVALSVCDYCTADARMRAAQDAIGIARWRIEHELAECST